MATALVQTGVQFPGGTIQTSAIDSGIIAMWSGAIDELPTGWFLCDGSNGTPDLRDKFVVNVGPAYAYQATGGSKDSVLIDHSHPSPGITNEVGDHQHSTFHTHTGTSTPAGTHNHTFTYRVQDANDHTHTFPEASPTVPRRTDPAGDHTHFLSWESNPDGVPSGLHRHIPGYVWNVDINLEPAAGYNGGHNHTALNIGPSSIQDFQFDNSEQVYLVSSTAFPIINTTAPAANPHVHYGYTDFDGPHSHPIPAEARLEAQYFDQGGQNFHEHVFPGSLADPTMSPAGDHFHSGTIRMPDGSIPGVVVGTPLANDPSILHSHSWTFGDSSPVRVNPATINNDMQQAGSHSHPGSAILEPPESFPGTYKNMPPFYALAFIMKA